MHNTCSFQVLYVIVHLTLVDVPCFMQYKVQYYIAVVWLLPQYSKFLPVLRSTLMTHLYFLIYQQRKTLMSQVMLKCQSGISCWHSIRVNNTQQFCVSWQHITCEPVYPPKMGKHHQRWLEGIQHAESQDSQLFGHAVCGYVILTHTNNEWF